MVKVRLSVGPVLNISKRHGSCKNIFPYTAALSCAQCTFCENSSKYAVNLKTHKIQSGEVGTVLNVSNKQDTYDNPHQVLVPFIGTVNAFIQILIFIREKVWDLC